MSITRHVFRSQFFALADQGVSSVTNFLGVIAVARVLDSSLFGIFGISYSVLTLALGLWRAYFGIPIALSVTQGRAATDRRYGEATRFVALSAAPVVLIVAGAGLIGGGTARDPTVVLVAGAVAIATPMILIQDAARFFANATGVPGRALISDGVWLLGMVGAVIVGPLIGAQAVVLLWVTVVAAASLIALVLIPPGWAKGELRGLFRLGLRESLGLTVILVGGTGVLMNLIIAQALDPTAVGSLRGAGAMFGPLNALIAFLDFGLLSVLSVRSRKSDRTVLLLVSLTLGGISALWLALLISLPDELGRALLGQTWDGVAPLLPLTGLEYIFLCLMAAVTLTMKLNGAGGGILLGNAALCASTVLMGIFVLWSGGETQGLAASQAVSAGVAVSVMLAIVVTPPCAIVDSRRRSVGFGLALRSGDRRAPRD